jgi:hypothetical protein
MSGKKRPPPESLLGSGSPGVRLEEDAAYPPKLREEQGRLAHVHALQNISLTLAQSRDIQRLPTTSFSLVLRKEYFDCPQKYSLLAVHNIVTVMSCIDPSVRIVTKSPKVGPLLYLYSPSLWHRAMLVGSVADPGSH